MRRRDEHDGVSARSGPFDALRIAVVGAGAIGGTIGAHLVRAGHDVTFVDANGEHVDAIARHGLRIEGPLGGFAVRAAACRPEQIPGTFRTVLLCVKAQATAEAARGLLPFLAEDGYVVSLQNGLNELVLEAIVGRERTVGSFVNFGADYLSPGAVHYGGRGALVLGELDGRRSARLQALRGTLQAFEPDVRISANIWGFLWSKLAVGAMLFATASTDDAIADCYALPRYRPLFTAIATEVLTVALAAGVTPEPFDGFDPTAFLPGAAREASERSLDAMVAFNRRSAKTHSGVWRDLAVHRRPTEGEALLGPIVGIAARHGASAPLVTAILGLVRDLEQQRRRRDRANLDELERVRIEAGVEP